jgi:hypothetical protein
LHGGINNDLDVIIVDIYAFLSLNNVIEIIINAISHLALNIHVLVPIDDRLVLNDGKDIENG